MDPGLLGALGALLSGANREGDGGPGGGPGMGSIAILTVPGRGIVGTAITPNGQDGAFPLPIGLLQNLGGEVSRLPLSREEDAAAALGGIMTMMMEQMTRVAMQRSMEEQAPKIPPASERVRDALPRVVVTKEDLLDSTNSKCSVCLEDFQPGSRATRMLCGHLFCTMCIREWLREANSCPVCRYELATDNEEFESGRRSRMAGRQIRLKRAELRLLRISELRRLMDALGISGEGCLEKAELLRHLEVAPDIVVEEENTGATIYEKEELLTLDMPLLRNLLERHKVPYSIDDDVSEEEERSVALKSFAEFGWMKGSKERPSAAKDHELQSEKLSATENVKSTDSEDPGSCQNAEKEVVKPNSEQKEEAKEEKEKEEKAEKEKEEKEEKEKKEEKEENEKKESTEKDEQDQEEVDHREKGETPDTESGSQSATSSGRPRPLRPVGPAPATRRPLRSRSGAGLGPTTSEAGQ